MPRRHYLRRRERGSGRPEAGGGCRGARERADGQIDGADVHNTGVQYKFPREETKAKYKKNTITYRSDTVGNERRYILAIVKRSVSDHAPAFFC